MSTVLSMNLENQNIEILDNFVHLRQAVQMNNDLGVELNGKRRAFMKLRNIFTDRRTPSFVKAVLFNISILPVTIVRMRNVGDNARRRAEVRGDSIYRGTTHEHQQALAYL